MTDGEIIDTHLHLVNKSKLDYPWLSTAPALDTDWPLEAYTTQARQVGIGGALYMEMDVVDSLIEAEIDWVETLADTSDFPILGIIAACRPESLDFEAVLDRSAARDRVVGFRRPLHVVPDQTSQTEMFRANLRKLARHDLPFDLCVSAAQLPVAIELADAAPEVSMILDHCGVPDIAGGAWDDWAHNAAALAERPNVCAKISGVVAYSGTDWTPDQLAPWVNHVVECFGTDRVCWGGDWPVCTLGGGLSTWVSATRAIVADWSQDERAKLFSDNACRIWGLSSSQTGWRTGQSA